MLEFLIAKILLKGAVKTFIVKPIITATATIIPKQSIIQATLLGKDIVLASKDLFKFGMEALFDKYAGQKLDYTIEKISKKLFRIKPENEMAALFMKEYRNQEELIIDLNVMDEYLNLLIKDSMEKIEKYEDEIFDSDEAISQILYDFDLSLKRAEKNNFNTMEKEHALVEEILAKNIQIVEREMKLRKHPSKKLADHILEDFPSASKNVISEEEEIDEILHRIANKSSKVGKPIKRFQVSN